MKDRIKLVRKHLKLNQSEFGAKVGVKGNTIGNYELGLRTPSEAVIFSICREFKVDEDWLRTGEGEMFLQLDDDAEFNAICEQIQISDDNLIKNIIKAYWKMNNEQKKFLQKLINELAE